MSITPSETKNQILELYKQGKNKKQIAKTLKISRTTVSKYTQPSFVVSYSMRDIQNMNKLASKHISKLLKLEEEATEIKQRIIDYINTLSTIDLGYDQRPILSYQKLLNTQINLHDKILRTIQLFSPSKQVTIDTVNARGKVEVSADI